MSDDDRLTELFRAAASDAGAPAPGFDHDKVVSTSRRITARRRATVVGACVAGFALVGIGVVTLPGSGTASSVAAPAAEQPSAGEAAPAGAAQDQAAPAVPDAAAAQAAPSPFNGRPLGPGNAACAARQDPQLRTYLEQVLPEAIGAPAASTTDECLPAGQRYVTVEVDDAGRQGLFGVSYLPPGTIANIVAGAVSAPTASGGTVIVFSGPVGGTVPPPFADRVAAVAAFLAPRL